ncbi:hypothetical protein SAMN02910317_02076 [Ruminococcaceae bacterium FB2012]|nr:hypothetical protein SAMN02910317_02076 [Ruminococcaceae bacterium FB2012]
MSLYTRSASAPHSHIASVSFVMIGTATESLELTRPVQIMSFIFNIYSVYSIFGSCQAVFICNSPVFCIKRYRRSFVIKLDGVIKLISRREGWIWGIRINLCQNGGIIFV